MKRLSEIIKASRKKKLVPDDKFDLHMERARVNDIESRKSIFIVTSENGEDQRMRRMEIIPSIY